MEAWVNVEPALSAISWWCEPGKRLFERLAPPEALSVLEAVVAWRHPQAELDAIAPAGKYLIDHTSTYRGQTAGATILRHSLGVARTVAELGLEADIVAAALLHALWADGPRLREAIAGRFGENVRNILSASSDCLRTDWRGDEYADHAGIFRALLGTCAQGYAGMAAVIIALAGAYERLCRLPGRGHQSQGRALALQVMQVFAPMAERLGVRKLKTELEDRAFRILDYENYRRILEYLEPRRKTNEAFLGSVMGQVGEWLQVVGISAFVHARHKHPYSIYEKMLRRQKEITEINDLVGMRIIVDQVRDCYRVLEIVHALWTPIPEEFDDYIRERKPNGYQSLHTALVSEDGLKFEAQIRTWQMHAYAEFGVLAHWRYKGNPALGGEPFDRMFTALQSQLTIGKTYKQMDVMVRKMSAILGAENTSAHQG